MNFKNGLFGAAIASALFPTTAIAALFTADITPLNANLGSTASGTATFTLDKPGPTLRTLRVQVQATGLQDFTSLLSDIPVAVHIGHIHGQFAGNADRPLAQQGDGPFFNGTGGIVVNSVLPTLESARLNLDEVEQGVSDKLYLDFYESRASYGPVLLNLGYEPLEVPPEGVPPLSLFYKQVQAGLDLPALFPSGTEFNIDTTYTFDLTDPDQARMYNNLTPLEKREIVLHGLIVPTTVSDAVDIATNAEPGGPTAGIPLGNGLSLRAGAPVASGLIEAVDAQSVPEPRSMLGVLVLAIALGVVRRRLW